MPRAVRPPSAIVMRDTGGGPRWAITPMSECGPLRHRRLADEVRARIYDVDLDEAAEILRIATGAVVGMATRMPPSPDIAARIATGDVVGIARYEVDLDEA